MISCLLHFSLAGAQVCCIFHQPQHTHQKCWVKTILLSQTSIFWAWRGWRWLYTYMVIQMASKLRIRWKLKGYYALLLQSAKLFPTSHPWDQIRIYIKIPCTGWDPTHPSSNIKYLERLDVSITSCHGQWVEPVPTICCERLV